MTLYELTDQYIQLLDFASDPDTDPEVLADTLEGITGEIEDKAEGYIRVIKELEARQDKYKKEIERLQGQAKVFDNSIKRIKENLLQAMDTMNMPKISTEHFRVSVSKNGGLQPMFVEPDITKIPEQYIVLKAEANTKAIREALTAGEELPFAHLEERGRHLTIK